MAVSGVTAQRTGTAESGFSVFGNGQSEKLVFLQILAAQLQNQDPLKPMDDAQFVTQLAQLHSLEQLQTLNDTMTDFAAASEYNTLVGRGITLIGKEVVGLASDGKPVVGIVDSVRIEGDSLIVRVGGRDVTVITEIGAGASSDALSAAAIAAAVAAKLNPASPDAADHSSAEPSAEPETDPAGE